MFVEDQIKLKFTSKTGIQPSAASLDFSWLMKNGLQSGEQFFSELLALDFT
jgi:hypothetical protein